MDERNRRGHHSGPQAGGAGAGRECLLYKWLNRRSEKRSYTLQMFFNGLLKTFPLKEPHITISLFYRCSMNAK